MYLIGCLAALLPDVLAIHVPGTPLVLLVRRCLYCMINLITESKGIEATGWLCFTSREPVLHLELVFAPAGSCELATEPKHVKPI